MKKARDYNVSENQSFFLEVDTISLHASQIMSDKTFHAGIDYHVTKCNQSVKT